MGSSPHTRGALPDVHGRHRRQGIIPAYAGSTNPHLDTAKGSGGSSPHTRGAPDRGQARQPRDGIIPAYAGSTIRTVASVKRWRDHPRIRGEHELYPHEGRCEERIIPAYAGSTCEGRLGWGVPWDHPRIRGEHLRGAPGVGRAVGSSPHTRGAPTSRPPATIRRRIIPAYAGSTRGSPYHICRTGDHPRIRGEHTVCSLAPCWRRGSSPHTRGAPGADRSREPASRIIPAYAGSTSEFTGRIRGLLDHPRIRGEHRILPPAQTLPGGSSPHTRGAQDTAITDQRSARIIPAYAGSTAPGGRPAWTNRDHPRIRGEHPENRTDEMRTPGSSPHTRGARHHPDRARSALGIIPAYAGSTATRRHPQQAVPDHPRIRGEHDSDFFVVADTLGSSPHTRGAREFVDRERFPARIIPAYAGSTLSRFPTTPRPVGSSPHTRGAPGSDRAKPGKHRIIPAYAGSTHHRPPPDRIGRDHPRIRGEHPPARRPLDLRPGSSPHTRGAPGPVGVKPAGARIIPAYAGSTGLA